MSRPRLGEAPTVVSRYCLPEDLDGRVRARCEQLGRNRSDLVRQLLEGWLRRTDEIARLKGRKQASSRSAPRPAAAAAPRRRRRQKP